MDEIKYMVIYLDNSCEAHFTNDNVNTRLIISPCGSEFLFSNFDTDNTIQSSFKYRSAYPLSMVATKLQQVLAFRNKYCDGRPFVSPLLAENFPNGFWMSSENLVQVKWDVREMSLKTKNPIEKDYHNFFYVWKSICKNGEFRLHFNRKIILVKYPVKVPKSMDDEFEQKCDINQTIMKINKNNPSYVSKHLYKYVWNEQEFSLNSVPKIWQKVYEIMMDLVENKTQGDKCEFLNINLDEAMPLSCQSTHLHRFDKIETLSEPKVIYLNQTWYKLFYKTKSIEIMTPVIKKNTTTQYEREFGSIESNLDTFQDYLISDTTNGKYYSCYSLNRRTGDVEELKICVDNIPEFKTYIQKTLNYSNIMLKRINNIKCISNYTSCYINRKIEEIEPTKVIDDLLEKKRQINNSKDEHDSILKNSSQISIDFESINMNIKKQFYIKDVGHFKLTKTDCVSINFVDRVKLFMSDTSLVNYLNGNRQQSFCSLFLPDYSEHELCLEDKSLGDYFEKYMNFLDQWLSWLTSNKIIGDTEKCIEKISDDNQVEKIDYLTLDSYLRKLKRFNSSVIKDQEEEENNIINKPIEKLTSIRNILNENNNFLKNLSK